MLIEYALISGAGWLIGNQITNLIFHEQVKLEKQWYKTMEALKLEGFKIQKVTKIENGYNLVISIPNGKSFEDLEKHTKCINDNLKCICELENIRFSRILKAKIILKGVGKYEYTPIRPPRIEKIYIGKTADSKNFFIDLNKDSHLLICGKTGTGKSFLLATILTNIIKHYNKCYELYLCQTAKKDIDYLKNCGPVKATVYTPKETAALLQKAYDEIQKRAEIFAENGIKGISHYNEVSTKKMKRQIYVFEEISLYMADDTDTEQEAEDKKKVWSLLWKCVKLGREAGISIFMLSQRSTAANLGGSGEIKSQLCRITFQQAQAIDSNNVIDCDLATKLQEQECYVLSNNGLDLIKVPYVDKAFEILKKYVPEIKTFSKDPKAPAPKKKESGLIKESYIDMRVEEYNRLTEKQNNIIELKEVAAEMEVKETKKKGRPSKKGVNLKC